MTFAELEREIKGYDDNKKDGERENRQGGMDGREGRKKKTKHTHSK